MSVPSGEKAGRDTPRPDVKRRTFVPSSPATHRSPAYTKATWLLLIAGWLSSLVSLTSTAPTETGANSHRTRARDTNLHFVFTDHPSFLLVALRAGRPDLEAAGTPDYSPGNGSSPAALLGRWTWRFGLLDL